MTGSLKTLVNLHQPTPRPISEDSGSIMSWHYIFTLLSAKNKQIYLPQFQ